MHALRRLLLPLVVVVNWNSAGTIIHWWRPLLSVCVCRSSSRWTIHSKLPDCCKESNHREVLGVGFWRPMVYISRNDIKVCVVLIHRWKELIVAFHLYYCCGAPTQLSFNWMNSLLCVHTKCNASMWEHDYYASLTLFNPSCNADEFTTSNRNWFNEIAYGRRRRTCIACYSDVLPPLHTRLLCLCGKTQSIRSECN